MESSILHNADSAYLIEQDASCFLSACKTSANHVADLKKYIWMHYSFPSITNLNKKKSNLTVFTRRICVYHSVLKARMASHRHTYRSGEAKGQAQEETNQVMDTIGQKGQEVKDNTHETAQAAKGRTKGATQTTRDKGQEKGEVTKARVWQSKEVTKGKASELGQRAKDTAGAAKEKSEGFLQQTGEKAKNMAQTTADAVKNTFGMAKDDEEEDRVYYRKERD